MSLSTLPRHHHRRVTTSAMSTSKAPKVPGPSSYERQQADVGSSLYLGGIVMLGLLALIVWRGLF